jgi:pimeloyl-ACP methyl ester carboxylesterase
MDAAWFECAMQDGARILVRRCGAAGRLRLVLSHGNGLAIDGYRPFWEPLLDRYEVVLVDFRNHGRNPPHGALGHDWANFAQDLDRLCDAIDAGFGRKPSVGVFHSMSAIASLIHAQTIRWRWDALVLFEPPLYPPDGHSLQPAGRAHELRMAEWAAGRPARFTTPQELAQRFARSKSLRRWVPTAYRAMAEAILRAEPQSGDWVLACPPELESLIYATNMDAAVWKRLPEIAGPIMFICSDPEAEGADVNGRINLAAAKEFGLPCVSIPGTTHLLQIEKPRECIEAMERFLASLHLGS